VEYVNDEPAYFYFTIATALLGLFCCGITYWFPFREEKASQTSVQSILKTMSPGSQKRLQAQRLLEKDDSIRINMSSSPNQ
jgi:hypothetical protein